MDTLFLGRSIEQLEEVSSTNTYLQDLLKLKDLPEGYLVLTKEQSSGRGQLGNLWESEAGKNLTFSLLLKPSFLLINEQFMLSKVVALGLLDFLNKTIDPDKAQIKWPNDILVDQKKIAGVLIENSLSGGKISYSVIGIGLNVNQQNFKLYNRPATSISLISGKSQDLMLCLENLLKSIEKWYVRLRNGRFLEINSAYQNHLYGYQQMLRFKSGESEFQGKIEGVDNRGKLVVTNDMGTIAYDLKAIAFID